MKAIKAVQAGHVGKVTWARSRETHPGPHSAWFWDAQQAGGGAIIDLGCHCIEIIRSFVGKDNRPRRGDRAGPTRWCTRSRPRTTRSR